MFRFAALSIAALVAVSSAVAPVRAQEVPAAPTATAAAAPAPLTLAWRFEKGMRLRYRLTQEQVQRVTGGPIPRSTQRQVVVFAQEVRDVAPDGTATLTATYEAVRVDVDRGGAGGKLIWDSTLPTDRTRAALPAVRPLAALVGLAVTYRMTPRGEVSDVAGFERAIEAVLEPMAADPRAAAAADQIRKSFGNMAMQRQLESAFRVVPPGPAAPGATWSSAHEQEVPALGTLRFDHAYRLGGVEEIDGERRARVTIASTVTRTAAPAGDAADPMTSSMEIELIEAASEGEAWFAVDAGRLARTSLTTTMQVAMRARRAAPAGGAGANGPPVRPPEMRQHVDQRTALELIPLDAPPF